MNNKRTMVIPIVAILAVIISVASSLAFTGSSGSTQLIPVTGRSSSGGSQPEQIAQQSLPAYIDSKAQWRNSVEEFIRGQQSLPAYRDGKAQWRNSIEEFIRGQQSSSVSPAVFVDMDPSWDHISGQPALLGNPITSVDLDPTWDHISGQLALPFNSSSPVVVDPSWDHNSGH